MSSIQPSSFSKQFASLEITGIQLTGKILGKGSDATVKEANWVGTSCAAKQLHEILLEDDSPGGAKWFVDNFEKECMTWSKLIHPHIVQFLGVYFLPGSRVPMLILEKMDTSLRHYLENHTKEDFVLPNKIYVLRQVAQALSYLHSRSPPLVHHDLSVNNVLLNEVSLQAKVTDFGMTRAMDPSKMTRKSSAKGTQAFMPPEALHSPPKYNEKLDVFSYGNVIVTMVIHDWPEPGPPTAFDRGKIIGFSELQRRQQYLVLFTPEENELFLPIIDPCLQNDPTMRPTSIQLVTQMRGIEESHPRKVENSTVIPQLRQDLQLKGEQLLVKDHQLLVKDHQLRVMDHQLREKDHQLREKDHQLRKKDQQLREKDQLLCEKDQQLREKYQHFREKDEQFREKDEQFREKDQQLCGMAQQLPVNNEKIQGHLEESGQQWEEIKDQGNLRKKWHNDDEFHCLHHNKSLREQGIDETEVLGLRKQLFFKDANLDQNDPIQMNLVYTKVKEDVIDGTHPVSKDEAVHLAALQCQVLYGNYNEAKHKPGFLRLNEVLPKEYVKMKDIEKIIYQEHRKHFSKSELSAKYHYITKCRSMPTYGATFFLMKEKLKGKKKLVPRLLGVSRSSVMRVDENTKEVLQRWELTSVKRWAVTTNTMTLDFGDSMKGYYSVQTSEGETIALLLSNYIGLILNPLAISTMPAIQEGEDHEIVEETVAGQKNTRITR